MSRVRSATPRARLRAAFERQARAWAGRADPTHVRRGKILTMRKAREKRAELMLDGKIDALEASHIAAKAGIALLIDQSRIRTFSSPVFAPS